MRIKKKDYRIHLYKVDLTSNTLTTSDLVAIAVDLYNRYPKKKEDQIDIVQKIRKSSIEEAVDILEKRWSKHIIFLE